MESRRAYRELLFTTPEFEKSVSGVILFDETLRQNATDGRPFARLLEGKGVLPRIKADKGAKPLAAHPSETVTEGLDGLRERLDEYRDLGAVFAKWRAVISIGDGIPSPVALEANAHALARYAALCQEARLVPIMEPEVLMDGDHDIHRFQDVTAATLTSVFSALFEHRIWLEGTLLKPNMVLSGTQSPTQAGTAEVAEKTVQCLRQSVPPAVPGIVFLSGGQSSERATENLNAINTMGKHPWELSFSYGRALQERALQAWRGKAENVPSAQKAFQHRARLNGLARNGRYDKSLEGG